MRSYTFGMAPMKSLVVCLQPHHHLSSSGAVAERAGTHCAMEAAAPAACVTSEPLAVGRLGAQISTRAWYTHCAMQLC